MSDLHLGHASGRAVLDDPAEVDRLRARIRTGDRLVLLGDVVEIDATRQAVIPARAVVERLADAVGPTGRVDVVAGNHDHEVVAPWLAARRASGRILCDQTTTDPADVGGIAGELYADLACPSALHHPGLWLAPGVYAWHGHYGDAHLHAGRTPVGFEAHDDALALNCVYHSRRHRRAGARREAPPRVPTRLGRAALAVTHAATITAQLRALRACGLSPRHLVYGHTHRASPRDGWASTGTVLHNSGSWLRPYPWIAASGIDGYLPRTLVILDMEGLRRERLDDVPS